MTPRQTACLWNLITRGEYDFLNCLEASDETRLDGYTHQDVEAVIRLMRKVMIVGHCLQVEKGEQII